MTKIAFYISLVISAIVFQSCNSDDQIVEPPKDIDEAIYKELRSGDFNITLNPHDISPLVAEVSFSTIEPSKITFANLQDDTREDSISVYSTDHTINVFALYPGLTNPIVIRMENEKGALDIDTIGILTEPLPDGFPEIKIDKLNTVKMEHGWHLAEMHLADDGSFKSYPIIFDHSGAVRWYLDIQFSNYIAWPVKFLENGNIFFSTNGQIYEVALTGEIINTWSPQGYGIHHEIQELPSGNFLAAVDKWTGPPTIFKDGAEVNSVEDHIIEIDRATGAVLKEWDLRKHLDVDRTALVDGGGDWFHMNAIYYDDATKSMIISGRNQGIVKLSWDDQLQWILAPHRGWGRAGADGSGVETSPYLLTAINGAGAIYPDGVQEGSIRSGDFDWCWGQHAPMLLPNGNLFVFDNGFNRNYAWSGSYTKAVEYHIDEANMTIEQVWQYGKERGTELQSQIISDVDFLENTGNRLMVAGTINHAGQHYSKIVEITHPEKEEVFEATLIFKDLNGSGEQAWGQLDIVYRGQRVDF